MKFTKTISLLIASLLVFTSVAADASEATQQSHAKAQSEKVVAHQLINAELQISLSANAFESTKSLAQNTAKQILDQESNNLTQKEEKALLITQLAD